MRFQVRDGGVYDCVEEKFVELCTMSMLLNTIDQLPKVTATTWSECGNEEPAIMLDGDFFALMFDKHYRDLLIEVINVLHEAR